ncbi:GMC oxidoreductase [Streptomyces europaeiscabiei]|uniref:GMC oxidoreductase n=1 Tax=Streptomyces europaeiscabiei TaxID=146819 RepID=UPI0007660B8A|nr:GMC oxidoreductase [Streptomyces europaeiscabiei]MDX3672826.1 GMC oxidoreductase [Streptomyces europaeiscabiei]
MTGGPGAVSPAETGFAYVVVGAGASGGPLAADLAAAGMRTLLLDAGGAQENDNYVVPAFHADASEDLVQCWNYFVEHYADERQQQRDSRLVPDRGILYPRAGTVGGCTAHHALITVYPYNGGWDAIAEETGDATWHGTAMQPVLRAAGTLHLPAEAQGAARQPPAGRAAHHAAEGAALRRRPVPQRRTPRIRRLAADRPRRPRTGRRGQAVAERTDDPSAVVDSRFRVPGVDRLRIVDASVFPRIPGFFVATPIRMISQKASDVILATAQGEPR